MAAVPQRWLNPEGDVIAYSDEAGALHVMEDGDFVRVSAHGQIGGSEYGPALWDEDEDEPGQPLEGTAIRVARTHSWRHRWEMNDEPDPAEEDPVLTSIVMAIPEDVNAIYILTQRLSHVLSELDEPTRETALARTKLQEAAHWMGAHLHAGGVADDG
jgi:hypothetical protein